MINKDPWDMTYGEIEAILNMFYFLKEKEIELKKEVKEDSE